MKSILTICTDFNMKFLISKISLFVILFSVPVTGFNSNYIYEIFVKNCYPVRHSSTDTQGSADTLESIARTIIEIAANDFYKNQKPFPKSFRNVELSYTIKKSGEVLYILCGQFLSVEGNEEVWITFATIKNADYEQWIGPSGNTYCEISTKIKYTRTNLTNDLKMKFDSLQNSKK